MVNDIRELLREAAASPPTAGDSVADVVRLGRRRVARRRTGVVGGVALLAVIGTGAVTLQPDGGEGDHVASRTVPRPDGPVVRLASAVPAVEGEDYEVVARHTNPDLDSADGQYFDGVTDDGLILFRDGPHGPENAVRYALLDPATGERDWLPEVDLAAQRWPAELSRDRLVLLSFRDEGSEPAQGIRATVFDRATRTWSTLEWPGLPASADLFQAEVGPDGRLYVGVPATEGAPPPGGWPTGPDGEAEDAGAEGETYDLWSVSLTDPADARDEQLRVGDVAFTDETMVWTATTNGVNRRIHVRDLATGAEHDFDPGSGERCNVLGLGASEDRIMLSQYCGTYDDGRDDRVQVLDLDGRTVTTIQGDGIAGQLNGDLVQLTSYPTGTAGTYVYELDTGDLVRVTDGVSSWALGGPTPEGQLLWHTPVGEASDPQGPVPGATQWLARWHS
ncbi:hypothetical protein [Nocardioides sp. SYSU DS0651]|uniref:hypothetical protein n=1 Tax=Nocardioides sp. SYSU DS0651 TaxID=3415955 RepID=UPI003F4BC458